MVHLHATTHNTTQHTRPTTSLALSAPTPILGLSNMLDKPRIKVGTERAKPVVGPRAVPCCALCAVAWKYNIEERNPLGTSL